MVLPVLAGLAWNLVLGPLPALLDELLSMLAQAVVPVCLLVIGLSLAQHGVRGAWRASVATCALKLLVLPFLVLLFARGLLDLQGVTLAVLVMAAALPAGRQRADLLAALPRTRRRDQRQRGDLDAGLRADGSAVARGVGLAGLISTRAGRPDAQAGFGTIRR